LNLSTNTIVIKGTVLFAIAYPITIMITMKFDYVITNGNNMK